MATPRKNDVALAIGGILMCTSVGTGLLATGIYAQPSIIAAQAEYLARTALMSAEELAAQQSQTTALAAGIGVAIVIILIMVATAYHYRSMMRNAPEALKPVEAEEPKGPWSTGASVWVGGGCIFGGAMASGIAAFCVGAYVEQLNNAALIEPLSIAAGVTGALALVCFAVDFYLNNKEPALQVA